MSDPSTTEPAERTVGSSAVRALWTLGVVLTVLAIGAIVYSQLAYASNYATTSFSSRPTNLLVAGMTGAFGSAALPGGFVCLGLALAVTAVVPRLTRGPEGGVDESAHPVAASGALPADLRFDLPRATDDAAPRTSVDPELFRRPSTDPRA